MLGILSFFEADSDWYALHYLNVIAGSIFRWQQAEPGAARAGHTFYISVIIFIERIDVNGDVLIWLHLFELGLFEIGGNPKV